MALVALVFVPTLCFRVAQTGTIVGMCGAIGGHKSRGQEDCGFLAVLGGGTVQEGEAAHVIPPIDLFASAHVLCKRAAEVVQTEGDEKGLEDDLDLLVVETGEKGGHPGLMSDALETSDEQRDGLTRQAADGE